MPFKLPKGFSLGSTKKGRAPKKTAMTLKDAAATAKALDKLDEKNYGEMAVSKERRSDPLKGSKGYGR